MQDYLIFLTSAGEREELQQWLLNDLGPRLRSSAHCSGLRINLAVEPVGGSAVYENEKRQGDDFDATIDLACETEGDFEVLIREIDEELSSAAEVHIYPVTRSVEHDSDEIQGTSPSVGYKIMRGFFFHEDLPQTARKRSWDSHVAAAKRIHGFSRYVRYWIGEPVTPNSPKIGGATNLHFADEATWKEKYFKIPDGQVHIAQDISHFIERGLARVFTREYILK